MLHYHLLGYLMDMKVLQECVRANVGDLTFEVLQINFPLPRSKKHLMHISLYLGSLCQIKTCIKHQRIF